MAFTRADAIKRGVIRMGGHAGTLSFTAGVSTRAILAGQASTSLDDSSYLGWHLFMLDAVNESDRERTVNKWQASSGAATWEVARLDVDSTSENYILAPPDYSLDDYRRALNLARRQTKFTYRYALPLIPGISDYPLSQLSWLEGADDIDNIFISRSQNMLHNEDFEFWTSGTAVAPDGWTLAGAGATVAQSSTGIHSPYSATVTRASGDATLYQSIPSGLLQYLVRSSSAPLPLVSFGAWVTTSTASIARVGVSNGTTTTWSPYHTGNGVLQFLSGTYQTTATDKDLQLVLSVDTTNGNASFHQGILVPSNTLPNQLKDFGSNSYDEYWPYAVPRNKGGWPAIELADNTGYGQLIIYARRLFPDLSADTDVIPDQYFDAQVAGMLRWLTDAEKPGQDRTRIDAIRQEEGAKWARANKKFIDRPVQPPPVRVVIGGA